jgi:hypothetical protein
VPPSALFNNLSSLGNTHLASKQYNVLSLLPQRGKKKNKAPFICLSNDNHLKEQMGQIALSESSYTVWEAQDRLSNTRNTARKQH